jgi:dihydroorotate dehydrogenase electron transfer subunit
VNAAEDSPHTHPLAAKFYADAARTYAVTVAQNERLARDTYRLRVLCPSLAASITPGQFVMIRLPSGNDPLLARPFALYDTVLDSHGAAVGIDVVYLVVGKMTRRLATLQSGQRLDLWGPLGNGFSDTPTDHLVMVAGGIGQTPMLALGREALGGRSYAQGTRHSPFAKRATLCYGVRTADLAAGIPDFEATGLAVQLSSDDGSLGHHGLVTDLLDSHLAGRSEESIRVVCCGPEPMMHAVAKRTSAAGVPCQVSLETPMACGLGICFSCVAKVRVDDDAEGPGWDYKRTCVEGPVFDAHAIVWDE